MIVLDDPSVINNRNIGDVWVPLLSPLDMQVAVPPDHFHEIEPKIGSFAIQPHYTEIGRIVASVVSGAEANGWWLRHKTVHSDKEIVFYRAGDGSIGREERLHNDILASFHPKRTDTEPARHAAGTGEPPDSHGIVASVDIPESAQASGPGTGAPVVASLQEIPGSEERIPSARTPVPGSPRIAKEAERPAAVKLAAGQARSGARSGSLDDRVRSQRRDPPVLADSIKDPFQYAAAPDSDTVSVEITAVTANVYRDLSPGLPVVGIGRCGDRLKARSEDSLWYLVDFFGVPGFLSKSDAAVVTPASSRGIPTVLRPPAAVAIPVLILFALAIFALSGSFSGRSRPGRIDCLLIARRTKRIPYSAVDARSVSLVSYLKNLGFHVKVTKKLDQLNDFLLLNVPDVVCIDWNFADDIQDTVIRMLREQMLSADFTLLYYNISDTPQITDEDFLGGRTFYFGNDFAVPDLNKVIPMIKTGLDSSQKHPDKPISFLEGKIGEDALTEILQLMDINKKTGCLLIEHHHPVGMIFIESGIITNAITNSHVAEAAVFELLSMKHGRFQFLPGKKPVKQQMQLDIVAVLMEKAKLVDEKFSNA